MLARESHVKTVFKVKLLTVPIRAGSETYGIRCVFRHQKSLNQLQTVPLLHVVLF